MGAWLYLSSLYCYSVFHSFARSVQFQQVCRAAPQANVDMRHAERWRSERNQSREFQMLSLLPNPHFCTLAIPFSFVRDTLYKSHWMPMKGKCAPLCQSVFTACSMKLLIGSVVGWAPWLGGCGLVVGWALALTELNLSFMCIHNHLHTTWS